MATGYTDEYRIAHHKKLREKEVVLEKPLPCSNIVMGGGKVYLHVDRDLPENTQQQDIRVFLGGERL
jgi:hypothetical protein